MKRNLNISFDASKRPKLSSSSTEEDNDFELINTEQVNFTTRIPVAPPRFQHEFWKFINEQKFQYWTREHVATLLILDEEHGGCNLSFQDAERFWNTEFDGKKLQEIVNKIRKSKTIDPGVSLVMREFRFERDLVIKLVTWLDYLVRNKFYYLWNDGQTNDFCKRYNIINDINVIKKHSIFNETIINPNFFYNNWELYCNELNINVNRELNISYLKLLLNIDHLNNTNLANNINSSNSDLVKNRVTINGSEEFELRTTNYRSNFNVYSVLSPNGSGTQKFQLNMASQSPSIIITGNSKDEIMLIEHILSTLPTKRLISGSQLLLITKLVYLLKIVESNLLNNLNMNEALAYLAQCQLNTDCCVKIMKYLIDYHFDLKKDFYQTTADLQTKYIAALKGKFPNLPNDFIICFDKCDLLDKLDFNTDMPVRCCPYSFTFVQTVIRTFAIVVSSYSYRNEQELRNIKNHLIFSNIYDDGDTIFPSGKICVSSEIKVNPIYIENNVTIEEFNDYFNGNYVNEIELIGKLNEILPLFPMRRDLFEKVINNLNLEYSEIGFSSWFKENGALSKEGILISNIMQLSEEFLFKEHKLIWSIFTTLYSTSLQIQSEHDFKDNLKDTEKERLSQLLTGYIESFQKKPSSTFRFYDTKSIITPLTRLQIILQEREEYSFTYSPNPFSYLQAKLCYSKWCLIR